MTKIYPSKTFSNRMQRFLKRVSKMDALKRSSAKIHATVTARTANANGRVGIARKFSTHGQTAFDTEFLY
jgi:hypothetical protein